MHLVNLKYLIVAQAVSILLFCPSAWGRIIFVDDGAIGSNDGSSWANAYRYLQDALADANSSEKPIEIRVAQGTYKPDQGANQTPVDREATFQLINGITIKGGYAGFGETDPNAQDVEAYETVLDGDLEGNDVGESGDLYTLLWSPLFGRQENSYHVVTGSGNDTTGVLDSVTISGGNENHWEHGIREAIPTGYGGGMLNISGSPTVINCNFFGNLAGKGAGIYNEHSNPLLSNCIFSRNLAWEGGGLYNDNSNPTLVSSVLMDNFGYMRGGAIYNNKSMMTITSCVFKGNHTIMGNGGGIGNEEQSNTTILNSVFAGNRANFGGAISNLDSSLELRNCSFVGNSGYGRDALGCRAYNGYVSSICATNCIFWDVSGEIENYGCSIKLSYCDFPKGQRVIYDPCETVVWGQGNIDSDPWFVDPGHWEDPCDTPYSHWDDLWIDGDYHLKSQAGRWDPNSQSWVKDDVTSPCVDAGDPMSPIGQEPFPNGGIINMGAYGGTAEASKSYFGEPVCETIIAGDINGDCKVNFKDFVLMSIHWLTNNNP